MSARTAFPEGSHEVLAARLREVKTKAEFQRVHDSGGGGLGAGAQRKHPSGELALYHPRCPYQTQAPLSVNSKQLKHYSDDVMDGVCSTREKG
ncbi:MAG: hypothetical protein H6974_11245 [Gammaproteobacteria bacterium]|nr:hypothetical protein [Gammaproteobacteria bacterium]